MVLVQIAHSLRVLIVAGSPEGVQPQVLRSEDAAADLVIAVDSGGDVCVSVGIGVDVLVGDLDSITPEALSALIDAGTRIDRYPSDKDVTDLALALLEAERLGAASVRVLGALGGRLDHELCVWGDVARAAHLSPTLVGRGVEAHLLSASGRALMHLEGQGSVVSLLPLLGSALVSARGMRWELDRASIDPLSGHGLSNEVSATRGEIEIHEGVVAVVVHDVQGLP